MRFILSVDAGTTSVRAMLFGRGGEVLAVSQRQLTQIYPEPGLVEHDASEIWDLCRVTIGEALSRPGIDPAECVAFAVTNQRETAVVWDPETGTPLCNAIVWQDRRTGPFCEELASRGYDDEVFSRTGLHIDPYFTGTKIRWILDNVPGARDAAESGKAIAGTVDSWIIWNLTGGKVHATDYSNASRTMLFNIRDLDWDPVLLEMVGVPRSMLPEPHPTGHVFGTTDPGAVGVEVPIAGSMGDQQAALFGQQCLSEGDVKVTFGTGGFLLMNLGTEPVLSRNGLLTTVAWTSGGKTYYAVEGSIYIAGAAVQWLRDELQIVEASEETERMAESVPDTAGCTVVPAFSGLGAPHWDQGARGMIMGLTRGTNRNHLARAALESIAFQACEVVRAMTADTGRPASSIRVDGGASANDFLCRFLADITGVRVLRPKVIESTALGAAYEAGLTVGFWDDVSELETNWRLDREFVPSMSEEERSRRLAEWSKAVECAKAWSRICGERDGRRRPEHRLRDAVRRVRGPEGPEGVQPRHGPDVPVRRACPGHGRLRRPELRLLGVRGDRRRGRGIHRHRARDVGMGREGHAGAGLRRDAGRRRPGEAHGRRPQALEDTRSHGDRRGYCAVRDRAPDPRRVTTSSRR